ncbi:MAG: UbiA family prenyltransferase, partial [Rhodoferax sp.]
MTTLAEKDEAPLWRAYWELTKPRVVALLMVTAVIGMFLATPGLPPLRVLLLGSLGLALAMMSSAVINQVMDQRIDAIMARTRQRPLVQGRVDTRAALLFAFVLCLLSLAILTVYINPLTAVLTFFGVIGYAGIYTL